MRTLNIPMNKAEKTRLNLLENLDTLLVPMNPDVLGPFGIRFQASTLVLTHKDRDVAFVPEFMSGNGKSFDLRVLVDPSDVVDAALRTLFARVTDHLNLVSRLDNQRKKEAKIAADAEAVQHRLDLIAQAEAASGVIMNFFTDTPPKPVRMSTEDFVMAKRLHGAHDTLRFRAHYAHQNGLLRTAVVFSPFDQLIIKFDGGDETVCPHAHIQKTDERLDVAAQIIYDKVKDKYLDPQKLCDAILAKAERNRRVTSIENLGDAVKAYGASVYDPYPFVLSPPDRDLKGERVLADEYEVRCTGTSITIVREDCEILSLQIVVGTAPQDRLKGMLRNFTYSGQIDIKKMPDATLNALICMWIDVIVEHNPDLDMSAYLRVDMEDLENDARNVDVGYGF